MMCSLEAPEGDTYQGLFIISSGCEKQLAEEQEQYQDLLFVDVKDSYFTLTRKVVAEFTPASERACVCVCVCVCVCDKEEWMEVTIAQTHPLILILSSYCRFCYFLTTPTSSGPSSR